MNRENTVTSKDQAQENFQELAHQLKMNADSQSRNLLFERYGHPEVFENFLTMVTDICNLSSLSVKKKRSEPGHPMTYSVVSTGESLAQRVTEKVSSESRLFIQLQPTSVSLLSEVSNQAETLLFQLLGRNTDSANSAIFKLSNELIQTQTAALIDTLFPSDRGFSDKDRTALVKLFHDFMTFHPLVREALLEGLGQALTETPPLPLTRVMHPSIYMDFMRWLNLDDADTTSLRKKFTQLTRQKLLSKMKDKRDESDSLNTLVLPDLDQRLESLFEADDYFLDTKAGLLQFSGSTMASMARVLNWLPELSDFVITMQNIEARQNLSLERCLSLPYGPHGFELFQHLKDFSVRTGFSPLFLRMSDLEILLADFILATNPHDAGRALQQCLVILDQVRSKGERHPLHANTPEAPLFKELEILTTHIEKLFAELTNEKPKNDDRKNY